MGSRLKVLGAVFGAAIVLFVVLWVFSGAPSFGAWLASATEAEAGFWGAIIGALSSGLIAITILAADLDHRERDQTTRRLSLARALKAEIADMLIGFSTGLMNMEYLATTRGEEVPTTRITMLFHNRPLIAATPEAIYELGEEIGRLFARLRTMLIRIEINADGFTFHPTDRAPLLESSIREATRIGCELLAAIDQVDGETNSLSADEWRDHVREQARMSFEITQRVRAKAARKAPADDPL